MRGGAHSDGTGSDGIKANSDTLFAQRLRAGAQGNAVFAIRLGPKTDCDCRPLGCSSPVSHCDSGFSRGDRAVTDGECAGAVFCNRSPVADADRSGPVRRGRPRGRRGCRRADGDGLASLQVVCYPVRDSRRVRYPGVVSDAADGGEAAVPLRDLACPGARAAYTGTDGAHNRHTGLRRACQSSQGARRQHRPQLAAARLALRFRDFGHGYPHARRFVP